MRALKFLGKISLLLALAFIFIKIFFPYYQVKSDSMEPTIKKGDILFISRLHYKIFKPKRNDIVLFKQQEGVFTKGAWTHRVVAVEGDVVTIKDRIIRVNGEKVMYSEIKNADDVKLEIPVSKTFQKGDNLNTIYGLVDNDLIIGKVLFHF